jgi:hypothetical protein
VESGTDIDECGTKLVGRPHSQLLLLASRRGSLRAANFCSICAKPDTIYRCTVDQSTQFVRLKFGEVVQGRICTKVLAKKAIMSTAPFPETPAPSVTALSICDGSPRIITFTDYEQIIAGDETSTYEPGLRR